MRNHSEIGRDDWIRTSDPLNPICADGSRLTDRLKALYRRNRFGRLANRLADADDIAAEREYDALAERLQERPRWLRLVYAALFLAGFWLMLLGY